MSIRKLVQKTTVTVEGENSLQSFTLEYYTLERETDVDGFYVNTFGIEVLKRHHPDEKTLKVEYRKIFDIFCTEEKAKEVAWILAENTVTPISLRDIIEQFIGTDEIACEEYEIIAV